MSLFCTMTITIWFWKWEDENYVQIDTLQISIMPFLFWVAFLHRYSHSFWLLWIWLKNRSIRDVGCLALSITLLSGRTSINDPAERILIIVNRVKQNQNPGRLGFCLLERTRDLCCIVLCCSSAHNKLIHKFHHFSFLWGKLRHKKVQLNFSLGP